MFGVGELEDGGSFSVLCPCAMYFKIVHTESTKDCSGWNRNLPCLRSIVTAFHKTGILYRIVTREA